ncbi:MAG: hypothetical protein LKM45_06955, partial [Wolbachia endosymbiont of Alcedoecus sp.]|nr:hypothetical protein [Wolbachia endosymbiont of Alcedoecus sp.]
EKENEYLKKKNAELEKLSQEIAEESDRREGELIEENQALQKKIMGLKTKLERMIKELDSKNQDIELLKQQISALEQDQRDRDAKIAELKKQLVDEKGKVLSADKTNEELCKKLEKSEAELNKLRAENTTLKSDLEKIVKGIEGGKEEQLAEQLMKAKKETETLADEVNRLAEELNQLQKEKENLEKVIRQSKWVESFLQMRR